ncbi:polypyrimidine tract-binding protein homolog 2 isoform X1 [Tanacetum coccineum]
MKPSQPIPLENHNNPQVLPILLLQRLGALPKELFKDVVKDGWDLPLLYDHGNLHDNVKRLRFELDKVQSDLDLDLSNNILREEEAAYVLAFNEALIMEEIFVKQKAKIEWLRADQVPMAFVNHYTAFLGQQGVTSNLNTHNLFTKKLDSNVAFEMIKTVTNQEVKDAIFSMGNGKSPGPDGYTTTFFKEDWDVVANDVTKAVQEFFTNGKLLKELNHTIITLIPKSLKYLISQNQSAFVSGRRISNNILLTQELMHNYHLDRGPPRCAFKVDIQKAYDIVDWGFLKQTLMGFGFHDRMIHWIMKCVTSTSFSLSINGVLHGYFKGQLGLRQGDHMSPYLFTLIMEILTLMLQRRVREDDSFTYHRYCDKLDIINLCFVDDLFLFAHGDEDSDQVIMGALDEFKLASGLTPNLPKSTAYFCNVLNHAKLSILNILPFKEGHLHVKYLGVLLISSRLIHQDCRELIKKASIFTLPSCVLLDIEQLMHGFLWCQGDMRKGKAKVAWEVVCLPKKEGGLGLCRLDIFNKALMVSHIWSLLSLKESCG